MLSGFSTTPDNGAIRVPQVFGHGPEFDGLGSFAAGEQGIIDPRRWTDNDETQKQHFGVRIVGFIKDNVPTIVPRVVERIDQMWNAESTVERRERIAEKVGAAAVDKTILYVDPRVESIVPEVVGSPDQVGEDHVAFGMYKFRTMINATPEQRAERDRQIASGEFEKTPDDPWITRIGKVLRKTSIDETPQLLNILAGKMSLVGGVRPIKAAEVQLMRNSAFEMGVDFDKIYHQAGLGLITVGHETGDRNLNTHEQRQAYIENALEAIRRSDEGERSVSVSKVFRAVLSGTQAC